MKTPPDVLLLTVLPSHPLPAHYLSQHGMEKAEVVSDPLEISFTFISVAKVVTQLSWIILFSVT